LSTLWLSPVRMLCQQAQAYRQELIMMCVHRGVK
jgi:hypothetical protein